MRRVVGVVLAGVLFALTLTACSPGPVDPTADCSDEGSPPPAEPGSAEVLLTVGNATGTSLLTMVLYADGWVLTLDGEDSSAVTALRVPMMVPSPPAARQWQPGYLDACQLEAAAELAADELTQDSDLGDPTITDQATTFVTYYGGAAPATTSAYALGQEDDAGALSSSDEAGREVLKGLIAALDEAPAEEGLLEVETVQLITNGNVDLPPDWPGPPLADVIADDENCGELTGQVARDVFEYVADRGDLDALRLEVMPPGLPTCT